MSSEPKLQLPAGLIKFLLATEFAFLFFGIPLLMYFDTGFKLPSALLIPVIVIILGILRYWTDFSWKELIYSKDKETKH
ncbi:MAG TPA: hypothetical protein ENI20_00130 [Bacteroides sp.]|nr:hypothetical protein [Bacteroides sp.]